MLKKFWRFMIFYLFFFFKYKTRDWSLILIKYINEILWFYLL